MQVFPDEMTTNEIRSVIRRFVDAAVRAQKAGFDGVQIHAAHFFFLSRFISPAINHRTDEYGVSAKNRARILLEILEWIREAAPLLHITVKINSNDFTRGGLDFMEKVLNETGIGLISLSRPLLCEPDLPNKMKADPGVISGCVSCNACYSTRAYRCIFRDAARRKD